MMLRWMVSLGSSVTVAGNGSILIVRSPLVKTLTSEVLLKTPNVKRSSNKRDLEKKKSVKLTRLRKMAQSVKKINKIRRVLDKGMSLRTNSLKRSRSSSLTTVSHAGRLKKIRSQKNFPRSSHR